MLKTRNTGRHVPSTSLGDQCVDWTTMCNLRIPPELRPAYCGGAQTLFLRRLSYSATCSWQSWGCDLPIMCFLGWSWFPYFIFLSPSLQCLEAFRLWSGLGIALCNLLCGGLFFAGGLLTWLSASILIACGYDIVETLGCKELGDFLASMVVSTGDYWLNLLSPTWISGLSSYLTCHISYP